MASSDRPTTDPRESYEPPQICEIGSLQELTAGMSMTGPDALGQTS